MFILKESSVSGNCINGYVRTLFAVLSTYIIKEHDERVVPEANTLQPAIAGRVHALDGVT